MSETNAKGEFLSEVDGYEILCAGVTRDRSCGWDDSVKFDKALPVGFTPQEYAAFLESLDFSYDSGYGGQELFGTIWYKDGTWSSRGEYDGSEWWERNVVPTIPDELKGQP